MVSSEDFYDLAVVMSTFNESRSGVFDKVLEAFSDSSKIQKIAVDGGSKDNTVELLKQSGFQVFKTSLKARAERLNLGLEQVRAKRVLLQHSRSCLHPQALSALLALSATVNWGGFYHSFDHRHPVLRFTSFYSNHIRPRRARIIYLDHCIFITKNVLEALPKPIVPEVHVFEDTRLCVRLKRFGTPYLIPLPVTTSAARFVKNGIYRQAILNQMMKLGYYLHLPSPFLNKVYEKGLGLNTRYED